MENTSNTDIRADNQSYPAKAEIPPVNPYKSSAERKNSYEQFRQLDPEGTETAYKKFQMLVVTVIEELMTECSSTFLNICCQSRKKQCQELSLTDVTYLPKAFGIDDTPAVSEIDTNDADNIIKAVIYCLRNQGFKDEIRSYFYNEYKRNLERAVNHGQWMNELLSNLDTTLIQLHKQNYKISQIVKNEGLSQAVKEWADTEKANLMAETVKAKKEAYDLRERASEIRREAERYNEECRRKAERDAELYLKKKQSEITNK